MVQSWTEASRNVFFPSCFSCVNKQPPLIRPCPFSLLALRVRTNRSGKAPVYYAHSLLKNLFIT